MVFELAQSQRSGQRRWLAAALAAAAGTAITLSAAFAQAPQSPGQPGVPVPGQPVAPTNVTPATNPATAPKPAAPATTPAPVKPAGVPESKVPTSGTVVPATPTPLTTPGSTPAANPAQPPAPAAQPVTTPANGAKLQTVPPLGKGDGDAMALLNEPASGEMIQFGPFSEAIKVKELADLVQREMHIQIIWTDVAAAKDKSVILPNKIMVPKNKLLSFLALVLEQNGLILQKDMIGDIYFVRPAAESVPVPGNSEFSGIQILSTMGMKPTALLADLTNALKPSGAAAAAGGGASAITAVDDLGVFIVADTSRHVEVLREMIREIAEEQSKIGFTRFDLKYISATTARTRMLELQGRIVREGASASPGQPNANPLPATGPVGSLSHLAERLTADPTRNSLLFRGRPDEMTAVTDLLKLVDVPNLLEPKWYPAGAASSTIAEEGRREGLGTVIKLQSLSQPGVNGQVQGQPNVNAALQQAGDAGGPVFIIDGEGRGFVFYGTKEQHERVEVMQKNFSQLTEAEDVVFDFYKLKHAKSADVADVVRGLLTNTATTGGTNAPLVQGAQRQPNGTTMPNLRQAPNRPGAGGGENANEIASIDVTADTFIQSDDKNNQLVVKAPRRLQKQFARLIAQLDQRRPQVYVEAKIVVVSSDRDFQLAFEEQLKHAGNLVARTAFVTGGGALLAKPVVSTVNAGLTGAIIKSDYVPLIVTALENDNTGRVVAAPRLLVDDNEEATISSLTQEPTTTTSQSGSAGSTVSGFGGYVSAGPKLTITPQISSGDYLKLKYDLQLSSFTGTGNATAGTPPAQQENDVKSNSVTVPSDSTIVVGGLTLNDVRHGVLKIPFLGDIPLIGLLFQSQHDQETHSTIYVFITPRIMRDPNFEDLRLLSRGPTVAAKLTDDLPPIATPEMVSIIGSSMPLPWQGGALGQDAPVAPPAPLSPPVPPGAPTPQAKPATPPVNLPDDGPDPAANSLGASSEESTAGGR